MCYWTMLDSPKPWKQPWPISYLSATDPQREVSPFHCTEEGDRRTERLGNLPRISQPLRGWVRSQTSIHLTATYGKFLFSCGDFHRHEPHHARTPGFLFLAGPDWSPHVQSYNRKRRQAQGSHRKGTRDIEFNCRRHSYVHLEDLRWG